MPDLNRLEASEIAPFLYQGSAPPKGPHLSECGFHVVVLCADEFQPLAKLFDNLDVIHAPNDDNSMRPISRQELDIAIRAARQVAEHIKNGRHVLVSCMAGLNRSGLVSALTLHMLFGWGGATCAAHVQSKREHALCNPQFVKVLSMIQAKVTKSGVQASNDSHGSPTRRARHR